MKEQNYKKHIQPGGIHLDKLQQGDFDYSERCEARHTLSEFAKSVRDSVSIISERGSATDKHQNR